MNSDFIILFSSLVYCRHGSVFCVNEDGAEDIFTSTLSSKSLIINAASRFFLFFSLGSPAAGAHLDFLLLLLLRQRRKTARARKQRGLSIETGGAHLLVFFSRVIFRCEPGRLPAESPMAIDGFLRTPMQCFWPRSERLSTSIWNDFNRDVMSLRPSDTYTCRYK